MKFRNLNKLTSSLKNSWLYIFAAFFILVSCKSKTNTEISSDDKGYDKNLSNNNYDWTGTYELEDNTILYTLKLHKRSVDASYEMQFYDNGNKSEIYKSSIYDAKDDSNSICIKFLNNYNTDASILGFKSGDTLFKLMHKDGKDSSVFKVFQPSIKSVVWKKTSSNYN